MFELIDILKYAIFYKKYKQPILHIISDDQKDILALTESFFLERDILNLDKLYFTTKYSSIVLDDIKIPDSLNKLLTDDGTVYFLTKNPTIAEKKLSIQFKYLKTEKITPNFKLIKNINISKTIKFESQEEFIYVVRASFKEIKDINYNIEFSFDTINSFVKNIIALKGSDINQTLKDKQIFLKKTISELFYKYRELEKGVENQPKNSNSEENIDSEENIEENKELNTLYNNLIVENNSNLSRISHLEFDLNELLLTKKELEDTVEELEMIFEKTDAEYKDKFDTLKKESDSKIEKFKEKYQETIYKLKEENQKSKKNIALLVAEVKRLRKKEKL